MSFKVIIEPSGHSFSVNEGEVVLDAAIRHGLSIPYGCRNGLCGACKGKIIEGGVSYLDGARPVALRREEEAVGQTLCCQALPKGDLVLEIHEVTGSNELPVRKMPARIAKMEKLADDVMRVFLKLPDTERMQYLAGQYIDILLADGRRRSFSIANAPHDDAFIELHIRLVEGGEFTQHVFNSMQEKDIIRIEGPYGQFYLREESTRPMLLIAGGTGFGPVKGIVEHALQERVIRPVSVYWGARTSADLYLDSVPQAWSENDNISYTPVLSAPVAADNWQGRTGFVHQAVVDDVEDFASVDVYVSGPPAMVQAAQEAFSLKGLPQDQFFFDSFEFASDSQP